MQVEAPAFQQLIKFKIIEFTMAANKDKPAYKVGKLYFIYYFACLEKGFSHRFRCVLVSCMFSATGTGALAVATIFVKGTGSRTGLFLY